jgi:hypothetical protein
MSSRRSFLQIFALCGLFLWLGLQPGLTQPATSKEGEAGWQALRAGDPNRAASLFYSALTKDPKDSTLHLGAGTAAHLLGRDQDAEVSVARALQLDPRLAPAHALLGELKYTRGDIDGAIRSLEEAVRYAPGVESLQTRLADWKKEAAVHSGMRERSDLRFTITFEGRTDSALAQQVAAFLNTEFMRIAQALGAYPSNRILVTLYTDQQFRDITRAPEWSGGVFDGKIRVPVRGADRNLDALHRVLTHELTHAIVFNIAPKNVPSWLHEGLAMHFEGVDAAAVERQLRNAGVSVPLDWLEGSFSRLTAQQAALAYTESLIATDVVVRTGVRLSMLLQTLNLGLPFNQSLERAGVRFATFDAALKQRLPSQQLRR